MVIQNAVYGGRSDMKTCDYNEDTDCTVSVTCVVKRLCDGKQNCSINVDQALFNIDPCPGKSKYLYLEFICADSKPIKQLHGEYSQYFIALALTHTSTINNLFRELVLFSTSIYLV